MRESYYEPTPPMLAFARAHGFEWPAGDGFAWEEMEHYLFAIDTPNGAVRIGFGSHIGGQNDAAAFLVKLATLEDVTCSCSPGRS